MRLTDRLAALSSIAELGPGRLPEDVLADLRSLDRRAGTRLRLSGEHTVVALAGATGSGKSSLFNVIAGAPLATVGIRRPTTSATQAAVFGPAGASELLDWLVIGNRQSRDASAPDLSGLVLLDLPDHDSVESSHRAEVDRLVKLVDAFIWVLDPQKYADAALHDAYLRPLAPHREVMAVALNQSDRLSGADLASCVRDMHRLLIDDGLTGVPVLATSALTADGVAPLREFLVATVADHRARTARVSADLDVMSDRLALLVPPRRSEPMLADAELKLLSALAAAAGVPTVVDAVAQTYRRRALAAVGWPPVRWIYNLRPDPLRRLGLGQSSAQGDVSKGAVSKGAVSQGDVLRRTSMPSTSAVSRAAADSAVRSLADTASTGLPSPWPRMLREAAKGRIAELPDALDRVVGAADFGMNQPPRWWRLIGVVQWVLMGAAVVGGGWLALIAVLAYLQIHVEAPSLGPLAWPTALLVGGLVFGLALRVVVSPLVAVGAARRSRRAASELHRRVDAVADDLVLAPLRAELGAYGEMSAAVARLRG